MPTETTAEAGHPGALGQEMYRQQVERLVEAGYPALLRVVEEAFREDLAVLSHRLPADLAAVSDRGTGSIPFVIAVNRALVPTSASLPLVRREGLKAIERLYPIKLEHFEPIENLALPMGVAYLMVDIDRGDAYRNVTPNDALELIHHAGRSPLTIEEGIAVLTQHPKFLQKNRCFSLLGSRCGDKRVPAFWLSELRPKLGWCWAGNIHSWLGSASCGARIGAR